jgi:hypothetical protein
MSMSVLFDAEDIKEGEDGDVVDEGMGGVVGMQEVKRKKNVEPEREIALWTLAGSGGLIM